MRMEWAVLAGAFLLTLELHAQQQPIAYVPTQGVALSGSLSVENGRASIANNGTITAGESTAHVTLARGGELALCASTTVHLERDRTIGESNAAGLMIALDRGALEANYTVGKYSDVLLTPDLRILISPPGKADLKIRVSKTGDTCVDNHGAGAPYVTVSNQFTGGIYRVQPNQRVLFEHGSLQQVVDNEQEPCGCPAPAPVSIASAAKAAHPIGGPSSTPADTAFPLAESEGLAPPPGLQTTPVAAPGEVHAQVRVPLSYNGNAPALPPLPPPKVSPVGNSTAAQPAAPAKPHRSFFGRLGQTPPIRALRSLWRHARGK